jgi:hypothetical protein
MFVRHILVLLKLLSARKIGWTRALRGLDIIDVKVDTHNTSRRRCKILHQCSLNDMLMPYVMRIG